VCASANRDGTTVEIADHPAKPLFLRAPAAAPAITASLLFL